MIIRNRSFPHPILAPFRDDVEPNRLDFGVIFGQDADNYYLDVRFDHDNATLHQLIETGEATYSVHLECKRNFYRETFSFSKSNERLSISTSELVGRVEVSGFIQAITPIAVYHIQGAHPDYGNVTFEIRSGDVLGAAYSRVFDAYVDYDPLKQISSILTICRSEDLDEGPMTIDTNDDRIVATLSHRDYEKYTSLKADPSLGPLLANQVVIPALLQGVHEIKETREEDFDVEMSKRWFRSVYKKLQDLGVDIRKPEASSFEAVQVILQLPIRRTLEGLIRLNPMEEEQ